MIVTENPKAAQQLIDLARQFQEEENARIDGVHVSDLIYCARKGWFRLHSAEGGAGLPEDPQFSLVLLVGHALHIMLQRRIPENRVVATFEGGPVHGTVDLHDPFFAELKSTRKTANAHPADASPQYFEQLGTYALFEGRTAGMAVILHLAGDYGKTTRWPLMKAWDVQWEEGELPAWRAELERRYAMVTGPELPPLEEHFEWECSECEWRKIGKCPGGSAERKAFFQRRTGKETTF